MHIEVTCTLHWSFSYSGLTYRTAKPLYTMYKTAATGNRKEMTGKQVRSESFPENSECWSWSDVARQTVPGSSSRLADYQATINYRLLYVGTMTDYVLQYFMQRSRHQSTFGNTEPVTASVVAVPMLTTQHLATDTDIAAKCHASLPRASNKAAQRFHAKDFQQVNLHATQSKCIIPPPCRLIR